MATQPKFPIPQLLQGRYEISMSQGVYVDPHHVASNDLVDFQEVLPNYVKDFVSHDEDGSSSSVLCIVFFFVRASSRMRRISLR